MSRNMKKFAAIAMGTAFLPWVGGGFLGGGGCYRNDAFAGLWTNVGNSAIQSLSDSSFFNDTVAASDYDTLVREPLTKITQSAWTDYVFGRYAADPAFPHLLSE